MVLSTGVPSLADKRYFLSQISSDASWKGIASTSLCSSLTTLFMDGYRSPEVSGLFFPINARTGERTALPPNSWKLHTSLYEATAVRQPPTPLPGSPTTQDVATQHLVLGSEE